MRALSTRNDAPAEASRPFDLDRDGFVMGEGAGVVVLEEYEHARRCGAVIYAELVGYGLSSDAHHITCPPPGGEGLARAIEAALQMGRVSTDQVDYINAHGTSTPANDASESAAIETVFGSGAQGISVSLTKAQPAIALRGGWNRGRLHRVGRTRRGGPAHGEPLENQTPPAGWTTPRGCVASGPSAAH